MNTRVIPSVLALILVTGGACATHEQSGAAAGAAVGGTVGYTATRGSFVGTLIGALIGAAVGADIGRHMDARDRREAAWALEHQPPGDPYAWRNPNTGYRYELTPDRRYQGARGPCRDFSILTRIDGEPAELRGTACRRPDGTWEAVRG